MGRALVHLGRELMEGEASWCGGGVCKIDWGLVVGPSEVEVACAYVIGVAEVPVGDWNVVAEGRGGLK